ncbi:YqeG family HAD IIIA-type phosphatase [Raoultibacter phocaeensis]|uniref:YqeG family HAD IIIA-type phosphatase n=1 Tax=Raoultibacter phocaeensis TaxID=2479841 RepID=UPI00111B4BCA|nr:HAD hydrolase-like protein [Raoultibacter phocaeensis]
MSLIEPERYFSRISMIDIQKDIVDAGFSHVLLDIDNTIFTRDTHEVPRDVAFWLSKARSAGITFCLVSNNWHEGVYELAGKLDLPIVAKAVKPLPPAFLIALRKIDAKRANTLMIGDQLITDVLGAHFLGMTAYLLQPLVEQDLKHTLMLRNVEKVFMRDREPEGAAGGLADVPVGSQPAAGGLADVPAGAQPVTAAREGGD